MASAADTPTLLSPAPGAEIAVGAGSAIFVAGRGPAGHGEGGPRAVTVAGRAHPLMGAGLPPPRARAGRDYWWTVVPLGPPDGPVEAELDLLTASNRLPLGAVHLQPTLPPVPEAGAAAEAARAARERSGAPLVAICMATYEPDPRLLRIQIDSIRHQTHPSWICLISDDGSSTAAREQILRLIAGDPRFVLAPSPRRRGFYANFERALSMVPAEAELVALSDQDDRWYEAKLETLVGALDRGSLLAYSDMRIVDERDREIAPTYWSFRDNNHTDFPSLVLANTVTGAASLFRRELLDAALPFPPRHGAAYHDHWLAQVALALGPLRYVDRPLHDYVQHGDATLGFLSANGSGRYSGSLASRTRISIARLRARRWHLGWRVPYFKLYVRTVIAATALELRLGERLAAADREFLRTIREPGAAARWLTARSARDLLRNTGTLGRERVMLAGLAWYGFEQLRLRVAPSAPRRGERSASAG